MALFELPPFLPFLLIAVAVLFTRGHLTTVLMLLAPIWGGINLLQLDPQTLWKVTLLDMELTPVRLDKLSLIFGYIFHIAAFIAILYSLHVKEPHATAVQSDLYRSRLGFSVCR